ncbi:hypothetical protein SK069_12175 [Patulibacter brassicae]|uniref:DUF892 family protein n=1 Tax=Patulibacter brassicae TaxID=1705717 RepID=A0ABU4VLW9_9ACTN|nr:hypothetical protein [Patulibacter brassicae]MDX8152357.1 hypothetical protein [Patulibacter brassicae]
MSHLETYLNDHLTAATGGLALAERARDAQDGRDQELHATLVEAARQIGEDHRALRDAMRALEVRPNPVKVVAGRVGELVGRLKPNGAVLRRSPLSTVIELEGLTIAVRGKRALWVALRELEDERLRDIDLERLIARADEQWALLETARRRVVRAVLAG